MPQAQSPVQKWWEEESLLNRYLAKPWMNTGRGLRLTGEALLEDPLAVLQGLGQALWDPVAAVGDVASGKEPLLVVNEAGEFVTNPRLAERMFDLATMITTGAGAIPAKALELRAGLGGVKPKDQSLLADTMELLNEFEGKKKAAELKDPLEEEMAKALAEISEPRLGANVLQFPEQALGPKGIDKNYLAENLGLDEDDIANFKSYESQLLAIDPELIDDINELVSFSAVQGDSPETILDSLDLMLKDAVPNPKPVPAAPKPDPGTKSSVILTELSKEMPSVMWGSVFNASKQFTDPEIKLDWLKTFQEQWKKDPSSFADTLGPYGGYNPASYVPPKPQPQSLEDLLPDWAEGERKPFLSGSAQRFPVQATGETLENLKAGGWFPKSLYHASDAQFREFRLPPSWDLEQAIFAGDDPVQIKGYGQNLYPVHFKLENPFEFDWKGRGYEASEMIDLIQQAKSLGHDSAIMENIYDLGGKQTQYLTFDPTNIRSIWADFDPAKWHLADLMAGLGGVGVLGAALAPNEAEAFDWQGRPQSPRVKDLRVPDPEAPATISERMTPPLRPEIFDQITPWALPVVKKARTEGAKKRLEDLLPEWR